MSTRGSPLGVRLYALAVRAFPKRIRETYGHEMVAAFAASHAAFLDESREQARRYARRATLDALARGVRERLSGGGVGAPEPGTPVGRWTARGRDMLWNQIGSDLRFATRTLARSKWFTITTVAVLALGVGINGGIFSAIQAALLAPLPYADSDQLVILDLAVAPEGQSGAPGSARSAGWGSRLQGVPDDQPVAVRAIPWSWPKYEVLAGIEDRPVAAMAAYATRSLTLTGRGDAIRLDAEVVTPGYLALLGITTAVGRTLSTADDEAASREVIVSHGLWQERLGGDHDAIGGPLVLNGQTMTVVGVAPAGFAGLSGRARLWVPVRSMPELISPILINGASAHWLQVIGRMRDDVPLEQLQERMAVIAGSVDEIAPWDEPGTRVTGSARSMAVERRNPRAQRAVLIAAGAAALVLLIACINLAALTLARGNDRRREIAVRLALGASRVRLARGLLAESLLLSAAGGVLGIGVAIVAVRAAAGLWPSAFANGGWNLAFVDAASFSFDAATLAYTFGLAMLTGLLFGTVPALRLSHAGLGAAMKEGAGATRRGHWSLGGRRALVAAEIAVALVLLVGAGLMLTSLGHLLDVEIGFDPDHLLVFQYALPRTSVHADNPAAFHEALLERLHDLPQVVSAAGGVAPLRGHWTITRMIRAGETVWDPDGSPGIGIQSVTDGYFDTLRSPIVRGRAFAATDTSGSPPVIVINETAARQFFGETDPIGKPFAVAYGPTQDDVPAEVIGVAADVLYDSADKGVMAEAYFSQRQAPEGDLEILVRTRGEPLQLLPDVRAEMTALDPDIPIYGETTVGDIAAAQVGDTRVVMQLLIAFAVMAVALAATGIWGVVSYNVVQRRRELGIRMALGARAGQTVALIVRDGMLSAVLGVIAGTVAALASARYLGSLLYEVGPTNPAAFAGAALLLVAVALVATWLPGRRATRVHPAETLRSE